jgi:hypothetical protein
MKRVMTISAALGLMAMTFASAPAAAQIVGSPIRFGVMGGASVPVSDFKNVAKTGWNAGALLDIGLPLIPIGFRVDGSWNQFPTKTVGTTDIKSRIIDGTANVVYTFGPTLPTKFYLIGGVGVYNIKFTTSGSVLVQLTGFSTFIEARYTNVFSGGNDANGGTKSLQYIPITVGITF